MKIIAPFCDRVEEDILLEKNVKGIFLERTWELEGA